MDFPLDNFLSSLNWFDHPQKFFYNSFSLWNIPHINPGQKRNNQKSCDELENSLFKFSEDQKIHKNFYNLQWPFQFEVATFFLTSIFEFIILALVTLAATLSTFPLDHIRFNYGVLYALNSCVSLGKSEKSRSRNH